MTETVHAGNGSSATTRRDPLRRGSPFALGFDVDPHGVRRRPVWINVFVHAVALPLASVWAIYRIFTTATGPGLWALTLGLFVFTTFGVTLGNHRYWTHRGFKARKPLRWLMAVASGMSVQGSIQQWAMTHRAHHRYADVVGVDPHSPYEYRGWHGLKGLVWAQGVWLLFDNPVWTQFQTQRDLLEDRVVQWEQKAFPFLALGQFVLLLGFYPLFGWNALLIAGALRVTTLLTTTGLVNSVCHRWGSRARDSRGNEYRRDDSRNNVLVALLTAGEGNHSWHHVDPACPRHGRKVDLDPEAVRSGVARDRGWRPDATWRLIQILAAAHLVYDVKRVRTTVYFSDKQREPNPSLAMTRRRWGLAEPPFPETSPAGPRPSRPS